MINKNVLIGFILAVVLVAVGFAAGWKSSRHALPPSQEPLYDTIVMVDTTSIIMPPDTITKTELKTVYVPQTSIVTVNDSTYGVELPYEQHHFSIPDTMDVWYSGYDSRIDSVKYYNRTTTIEIHDVVEAPQHWFALYGGASADWFDGGSAYKMFLEAEATIWKKIKVSANGGLAVFDSKASPYLGVTLKYKLN